MQKTVLMLIVDPNECVHQWEERESMFSNDYFADVYCPHCRTYGQQDRLDGSVFWPAT